MNNNPTVLEIDLTSVKFNLDFFRAELNENTRVMAVVKASGYGSDALLMAKFLENKVEYFAVAYVDEGIALRKQGIETPILVLHPQLSNLHLLHTYGLEPNLYSKKVLKRFLEIATEEKLDRYPVHLKFNTGLNRLGFDSTDLPFLHSELSENTSIKIHSIFSHLLASEDHKVRNLNLRQISKFNDISDKFNDLFGFYPLKHMCNTSGILNFHEAHFDMVRLGIGLYGFANQKESTCRLKNVLSLKSLISQIHTVQKGETVGYNCGFSANTKIRSATIPIGHADGLFRSLGNEKIFITINGYKAPVIGNICMDMIMADVTGIECNEGDEVILFETQDEILELAHKSNTISYEILTSFSDRIKRIIK